jgi:hypothetical protein
VAAIQSGALLLLGSLGLLLGPALVAALGLHWAERRLTRGLMAVAGRHAVLVTGWLGVPVHELSHALMCLLFRHRIQKLVLFHPDPKTGTLGYVTHSWDRRNPWQVVGSFFVGMAPLLGGAGVILGLHALLLPGALVLPAVHFPAALGDGAGWTDFGNGLWTGVQATGRATFSPERLASWPLWAFLYLTLCVGSHVSPSREDLKGSWVGGLAFLALWVLGGGAALALGAGPGLGRGALTVGLAVGLPLLLVACVNLPLALVVRTLGRLRR